MGLLVHNLPNSHNNLWAKWVPILEGQPHIPVSVAQINSHLHPLPQTNKQTKKPGQEIVKREKKGEKAKLDVQDACVMWKIQSREAHARHTVWQGSTHQTFNRHFLTQPPSPHSSWLISLQRPGRPGNSWATSRWQIRKQARKKVGLLEIPFQEVTDLSPSWSTGLRKAQNSETNQ